MSGRSPGQGQILSSRPVAIALVVLLVGGVWIAMLAGGDDTDASAPHGDDRSAGSWTVVRVVDGDTVEVRYGSTTETVRVIGIDTPERGECGFGEAASALSGMLLDEQVELTAGARDDRDRYERILRYVDLDDTDAGLHLIEKGLAIARYDSRDGYGRHRRQDAYVAADATTQHLCTTTLAPEPDPEPDPPASAGPGSGPNGAWANCTEARQAGAAPVHRGDAGYGEHLDGDRDGVGCE